MIAKSMRRIFIVAVLGLSASFAARAHAQCCGTGYGYSAYYQPSAYTAYSPTTYTSYYGSYRTAWYPGYFLDRVRARLWGSPSTYVASYPSTYYASYAPSYSVGYRPAYSVGYSTSYAAPAAGCSSCSYSAAYSPCSTCTTSCAPCTTCAAQPVGQAVYQQQSRGCASCGAGARVVQPGAVAVPGPAGAAHGPMAAPQQGGAGAADPRPEVAPSEEVGPRDTFRQQPANGSDQDIQPEPGSDTNGKDPYEVEGDPSTYFEGPKFFEGNDRTAQRSVAPVTNALYDKPVSYRQVSTQPITLQQAERDAAGWVSASK